MKPVMTSLVLGPMLRHVGERTATVWVETDRPGEVRVLGSAARTFTLHGHHYAVVEVDGLEPGSVTPYEVSLDGEPVWPLPGSAFPASTIATLGAPGPQRVAFGSCRKAPADPAAFGLDALSAYGHELSRGAQPPAVLLMIGDQVYADLPSDELKAVIRDRRSTEPQDEVADFEEYTELYRLAWAVDPAVRWLLSTVPTFMIFDDHDVRDDWNTSYAWRQEIAARPWWRQRIVGGIGAYWIYQHLGNLSPADRANDPLYQAVRGGARGGTEDGGKQLDEFAERADRDPASTRWSYTLELAGTRIVVVDSRCARLLTPDPRVRAMLDDTALEWFDAQATGGMDHLLIVSSIPYLLPPAIHHGEAWNERISGGSGRVARFGEKLRQAFDLEHWAAFDSSFRAVASAVRAVANGERGRAPATIAFLGGDVHYSYVAKVRNLPIFQLVCSPMRNPLTGVFRWANVVACRPITSGPARLVARLAGAPKPPLTWRITKAPWFDNDLATIELDGRLASVRWQTPATATTLRDCASTPLR